MLAKIERPKWCWTIFEGLNKKVSKFYRATKNNYLI